MEPQKTYHMTPEMMNRLVFAKALFLNGVDALNKPIFASSALALLSFQDAVEMVLGAAADRQDISLKPARDFLDLVKQVQDSLGKDLPYWSGINQLNKARVALKHHGIFPSQDTLTKARGDAEGFILNLVREAFGVDFRTLTMASLVEHNRTANWLRKAETSAEKGNHTDCLNACAVALALFRRAYLPLTDPHRYEDILRSSQSRQGEPYIQDGIFRLAEAMEKDVEELKERLEWVSLGVSIADYERFKSMSPQVHVAQSGKLYFESRHRRLVADGEASAFGISFVTQTILRLQEVFEPEPVFREKIVRRFRVIQSTDVIFDGDEQPAEILRTVKAGQQLAGRSERDDTSDWIALVEDGDWAKVRRGCVELVSERNIHE